MPRLSEARYAQSPSTPYLRRAWTSSAGNDPWGMVIDSEGAYADHRMRPAGLAESTSSVPPLVHRRAQELGVYLFQTNPVASRMVELIRDYTVGAEGIRYEAESKKTQKLLDRFWNDSRNDWDSRILDFAQDLAVYGEQLYTFLSHEDGLLVVQSVDPLQIAGATTSPADRSSVDAVFLKPEAIQGSASSDSISQERREELSKLRVIQHNDFGVLEGDCLFFRVNNISHDSRGLPDTLVVADWIDILDRFSYNTAEKASYLNQWFWDVEVQGGKSEVDNFKNNYLNNPPKPGAINVHNEGIKWSAVSPNLNGDDFSNLIQQFRTHTYTGSGFAAHFFGDATNTSRAVVAEINDPVFRFLRSRQSLIKSALKKMFAYQISIAKQKKVLPKSASERVEIFMPRVAVRDLQRTGGTIAKVVDAVDVAVKGKFLSEDEARNIVRALVEEAGLGVHLEQKFSEDKRNNKEEDEDV